MGTSGEGGNVSSHWEVPHMWGFGRGYLCSLGGELRVRYMAGKVEKDQQ